MVSRRELKPALFLPGVPMSETIANFSILSMSRSCQDARLAVNAICGCHATR